MCHCGVMTDGIPAELGAAFGVGDARRRGVSRARLRRRDLDSYFRGTRSVSGASLIIDADADRERPYPRTPERQRVLERVAQYRPIMSCEAFFSGTTAAVIWDAPLPRGILVLDPPENPDRVVFDADVVDVSVFWPARAPRGMGVRGHAIRPALAAVQTHAVHGIRVADPASTWAMMGAARLHPYDLIAIADHFVRIRRPPFTWPGKEVAPPSTTIDALASVVRAGRRVGVADLRDALPRVRTGAASRTETWTRLTLVDGGLAEPVLDHDVMHQGRFVATVDMAYPQWKIAVEYEGSHHNRNDQWESDIERYARLEAAGWRIIRVTKTMLFRNPEVLVARVRAALAERSR